MLIERPIKKKVPKWRSSSAIFILHKRFDINWNYRGARSTRNVNVATNRTHWRKERDQAFSTDLFYSIICCLCLSFLFHFSFDSIPFIFIHSLRKVTWRANMTMMIIYYRIILLINLSSLSLSLSLTYTELGFGSFSSLSYSLAASSYKKILFFFIYAIRSFEFGLMSRLWHRCCTPMGWVDCTCVRIIKNL